MLDPFDGHVCSEPCVVGKVVCEALSQAWTDKIDQVTDCHRQLDISACTAANKIAEKREMARDHHMLGGTGTTALA